MSEKLSVLLVDDSRVVLTQLKILIADLDGVEVAGTARDGAAAIRLVAELKPDLVLMDLVMPGVDGMSALRLITAQHPDVQVAVISSVGGTQSRAAEAFRLGAVQVLGKPFDAEILAALFESVRRSLPRPQEVHA